MSSFEEQSDPRPGIRAVLVMGFCAGNVCGLLYVLLAGHRVEASWLDAYALLALAGIVLGVGVIGTLVGAVVGLCSRLVLHRTGLSESWWPPVLLAGIASGTVGIGIASFLAGVLLEAGK